MATLELKTAARNRRTGVFFHGWLPMLHDPREEEQTRKKSTIR
jgi:hypothetical protein